MGTVTFIIVVNIIADARVKSPPKTVIVLLILLRIALPHLPVYFLDCLILIKLKAFSKLLTLNLELIAPLCVPTL